MAQQAVWIPEFVILFVQKPKLAVYSVVAVLSLAVLVSGLYLMGSPYNTYDFSPVWDRDVFFYRNITVPRLKETPFVSVAGVPLRKETTRVTYGNTGTVKIGQVESTHFTETLQGSRLFRNYSRIDERVEGIDVQINSFGVNCTFKVNFTQRTISGQTLYAEDLCFTVTWGSHFQVDPVSKALEKVTCFQWFSQNDGCRFPAGQQLLTNPLPMNERLIRTYIRITTDPEVSLQRVSKGTRQLTDGKDQSSLGLYLFLGGFWVLFWDIVLFLRDEQRYKTYFKAIRNACSNFKRNVKRRFCDKCCPDDDEGETEEEAREREIEEMKMKQGKNKKKHLDYEEFKRQEQAKHAKKHGDGAAAAASGGGGMGMGVGAATKAAGSSTDSKEDQLLTENMLMPAAPSAQHVTNDVLKKESKSYLSSAKNDMYSKDAAKKRMESQPKFITDASNTKQNKKSTVSSTGGGADAHSLQNALDLL